MTDYEDFKKGDRITFHGREGTLLSDSEYRSGRGGYGSQWGLYFASVKWDDGRVDRAFMLCRRGLEKLSRFRVSWWIHGAGRITRGFDIIKATELDEEEAESLIEADLLNVRGKGTTKYDMPAPDSCYKLKLPNFCKKHEELTFEAHHSEVSNWKVMKVTKERDDIRQT